MCFIFGIGEFILKFGFILFFIGGFIIIVLIFVFFCLFYLRIECNIFFYIKVFLYEFIVVGIFGGVVFIYFVINDI